MKYAVTGAFGYSGKYVALRLLARGDEVVTLTNSRRPDDPFQGKIPVFPLAFDRPDALEAVLRGVDVLINTYWVRFNHKTFTHADATRNTLVLFQAAQRAGVRRIVHISIANPSPDSPLEYHRCKARLESELRGMHCSHAILRPTVLFGKEDVLINNIAWALRRIPVMGVFGWGAYRIQPIYVDDLAALAVEQARHTENITLNAAGPETFAYRELVRVIRDGLGLKRLILPVPPVMGYAAGKIIGWMMRDIFLTRDEVKGLMAGLLSVDTPPTGVTRLSEWIKQNAGTLGRRYASELARRRVSP